MDRLLPNRPHCLAGWAADIAQSEPSTPEDVGIRLVDDRHLPTRAEVLAHIEELEDA
jgi:hypothetical protein